MTCADNGDRSTFKAFDETTAFSTQMTLRAQNSVLRSQGQLNRNKGGWLLMFVFRQAYDRLVFMYAGSQL